jgi:serine/threonine protein kinase
MASPQDQTPAPTLEKIAVEKGWATTEQVRSAIRYQAQKKVSISQAFVALGILSEVQVKRALEGRKARVPGKVDPSTASMIKGYRIERRLGSGGMGDVFLAQQISLDRPVALKILPPQLARDEEFIERFVSEARAAGKVAHENIVAAVDVGESNGRYFFVMELVEGPTLQQVITRDGALPEKRALEVTRQVARGLKQAHFHGLIHRDIKPANIMFTSENIAKICDFGLAREIGTDVTLTMPGIVQSSPAYASPEQCRGRQDLDHRTDMYSLGVTLFEMLTGKRPFHADTPSALFIKHATEAPPVPQSLNPAVSAGAQQLVLRLLRKEPGQRFETYDQLIEAIDAASKAKPLPKVKSQPARAIVARRRFPWAGLVAAVVLLGAAGGAFAVLHQPKPEPPPVAKPKPVDPEVERLRKSVADLERKVKEEKDTPRPEPVPEPPPAPVKPPEPPPEPVKAPKIVEEVAQPRPEPKPLVRVPVEPADHLKVLRTPSRRADPRERAKAAAAFRSGRTALHRAADVFLTAEMAAPKGLDEYLAALPIERADTLTTADHQGQFVALSRKIAESGEPNKDALYLFALAHAEELLAQNVRPDAESVRLAKLQAAKTVDFWGMPATVNRLAVARMLAGEAQPTELKRAADAISTAVDFPSRLLVALAAFREKEVDPVAAASMWKRLASYGKETAVSKVCDDVAERLRRASICDGCAGQGKYACKKCASQGMADCDRCRGSGRVKESDTGGMGYTGTIPCPGCKQKGKVLCPVCQGGKIARCEKCDGKKVKKAVAAAEFQDVLEPQRCGACRGTGNVFARVAFPCPSCEGVGRFSGPR